MRERDPGIIDFQRWASKFGYTEFERKADKFIDPCVQKVYRAWVLWQRYKGN